MVRRLLDSKAEPGCLRRVAERAATEALRAQRVVRAYGSVKGNSPLSRGQVYYLLRHPVFWQDPPQRHGLGRPAPGRHRPRYLGPGKGSDATSLTTDPLAILTQTPSRGTNPGVWLTGLLREVTGDRLTPTHTTRKGGRLRHYVSNRLISGVTDPTGWRMPGPKLQTAANNIVARNLRGGGLCIVPYPRAVRGRVRRGNPGCSYRTGHASQRH